MENSIAKLGASLLILAALNAPAFAQDAAKKDAAPAAAAPAAGEAKEATPKSHKKHHRRHHARKHQRGQSSEVARPASRQNELSSAMSREIEKRKGTGIYTSEERARDLDRDIENMEKAAAASRDDAHRARLMSMIDHLKAVRALHQ